MKALQDGQGEQLELSFGLEVRGKASRRVFSQPGPDGSATVLLQPRHQGSGNSLLAPDGAHKGFWLRKFRPLDRV